MSPDQSPPMLKWTVGQKQQNTTSSTSGSSTVQSSSPGPCYPICRTNVKFPVKPRTRRVSIHQLNKENRQCRKSVDNSSSNKQQKANSGETGTPRTRDSVYMRLDTLPAALRDVSNHYSPRLDSAGLSDSTNRVQRRRSYTKRQTKSPCSVPLHHRVQRRKSEPPYFIHEDNDEAEKKETSKAEVKSAPIPSPSNSPKKKQPCTEAHRYLTDFEKRKPFSSMQVELSPAVSNSRAAVPNTLNLGGKIGDQLEFPHHNHSRIANLTMAPGPTRYENPVSFTLDLSPPAEPDLLLHKELPITKTFNKPQIPRKLLQELQKVQLEAQSAVKEILLNSSGDFRDKKSKECQSGIVNKGTPCDVSPLARKLAWLRLNTQQPRSNLLGVCQEEDESLKQLPQSNISNRDYLSAIKTNIFNLDDRLDNLDDIKNSSKTNNDRLIENLLAKRRGICFNEHKFLLNTPFCNGNKENDSNRIISGTGNVEKTSLIDDNTPSTLKRQKVIRRRRRDTNLGCKEDFESLTKIPRRRVLSSSLLTLPDGIPSPFTQINGGAVELNGSTIGFYCTPEADHMRPGFILLDDSAVSTSTNNNNSSSHNKNNNLNTATNISVDSKSVLSIEGIEPLDKDQTPTPNLSCLNNDSSKVDTKSTDVPIMDDTLELTRKKNHWKRKLKQKKLKFEDTDQDLNVSSAESSCSDDTWDSHGMRLKTPRFATNFSPTFSFIAPGSSFASSIDKTDTTQTSSDVSSQQIASSPETLSERQSRSRRCLLFPSPGSSSRSKCKTVNHGLAWKRAKDKSTPQKAELELSLSLQNLSLTVHIKRGKNLSKASDNSPVNAYVKVNLVPSGSEKAYHRTCVRKDSTNPKFDQKFIMNLSEADLSKRILLSVWHRDRGKRKSEFLGCMSFAIKTVAEKEISGSFRFLAQGLNKTYHVLSTTPQNTDVMADQSESSVEETLSAEENPTSTHVPDAKSNIKEDLKSDPENSLFLRHLELDPLGSQNESRKGGRTPFTTTRELTKPPGQSFGFSIAWTHPPRVERVELGMPADRAGLRPGDFVVFINKVNVVTLPEEDVLSLIKACCNQLTIEVYRKIVPNGTINRGSTPGPPNTVPEKTVASVPPRSVSSPGAVGLPSNGDPHSKSRLHLPQISFTTEGRESGACILLNIEEEYALCLQFGISRFLLPLAERRDLINQHQHQTLFQNAQELLRLTEDVIEHLVQEEGDAFGTNVGLVYLNKMNVLCSAYRKYCIGLKKADCLLVEKTRNKEFMKLLSEPPIPRKRPDLTTFIHKPLEHFREVLKQLQNVQNSTNSKDPDYQSISKVVQQFQSSYREMTLKSGLMEPEGDGRPLLSVQDLESRLVFTRCKPFVVSAPGREWIFGGDLSRVEGRRIRSFWAILFSDLLVFAKVSRDRVLFITEEPLQLKTVKQALFNIRKKATEFRLLINMSKNNDDGNESPESEVTGCGLPDFTHTPRKSVRTRSVALRAPTLELKAVWQNLIQRQIIYLNTKARGRTPGSSPSDTPDSPSEQVNLMQELIENRCRQLCRRKSSVKKGSALHLSDWLKGRLGGNINTEPPSPEEEIETWSREALHERMWKLSKSGKREIHPRNESRMEDLELSEYSRSASRCTMNSQVIETVTKSPDRTMPVCRKCHKTCLLLPCNSNENNRNTSMSAAKQHLESTDFNANPIFDETNGNYDQLSPSDPFKPLPDIAVHPPSPPKRTQSQETEDDSEEEEDLPYQVLPPSSSSNLKRYGTMSSLEKLDDEPLESLETNEPAVSGQLESVSTYLGGWTSRAGSYVADKMSFFEKFGQDSFLDKYLNRTSQELPATSTNLAFDDEVETASGASGEELWGTPTSGPDFEMTSPLPESPSSGKDEYGETEKMSNIPPNAILSNVRNETGGRFFATRTRLDPLPEDEEDVSTTTSSSSPDTSACTQSCPTQQSARDSRLGAFNTSPGFFHRLKLRRSQSADSQPKPCNKLLEFLSSRRSANGRRRLTRLFSRESFSDDILTSLPQSPHTKGNDRRFWKQFRRKKHPNN